MPRSRTRRLARSVLAISRPCRSAKRSASRPAPRELRLPLFGELLTRQRPASRARSAALPGAVFRLVRMAQMKIDGDAPVLLSAPETAARRLARRLPVSSTPSGIACPAYFEAQGLGAVGSLEIAQNGIDHTKSVGRKAADRAGASGPDRRIARMRRG